MKSVKSITGYDDYLYEHMKKSFERAKKVDIIVSFLMESGVKLIVEELKLLKERKIPIRILTGNYLNITQPSALYLIKDLLGDSVDLRFFNDPNPKRSFHAKSYFFEYEDGKEMYIGSSNLSRSAWTDGVEWNFKVNQKDYPEDYNHYYETFEDLFYNHSILITDIELDFYSKNWKKNKIYTTTPFQVVNQELAAESESTNYTNLFEPRGAQIEALYHLKRTREEGFDKGLVVAATGIGKTYLAAFDSKEFERVLFVAHREEILKQAAKSFKNVRHLTEVGYFIGNQKDTTQDVIFASVQSLGKMDVLASKVFAPDHFDYIVIDEFHHAVAGNYQNIINYFKPKFLLGLTATPDRLDNKDVLAVCDYNLVYEAPLRKAINQGWLVPFRYYGIYDDTVNYDEVTYQNGKYQSKSLEEALAINKRGELVLSHYRKYISKRAMGFCSSKRHADFMAQFFVANGVKACAVYSGEGGPFSMERNEALSQLVKGDIQVIFSVDMFNEGLDIAAIDMVLMLRPTESPTIFLQQLGRGLRKSKDKKYLNVLDFIGNYKKANFTPYLIAGATKTDFTKTIDVIHQEELIPEDCSIDFDYQLINLFEKMDQSSMKLQDYIKEEYQRIKADLGYRPSRVELFTYMDEDLYIKMKSQSKLNIFKDYLKFLKNQNELTEEELMWIESDAASFINMIEKTAMSKTYKIPTILAFIQNNKLKLSITNDDLFHSFKSFYQQGSNGVDLKRDKGTKDYQTWRSKEYIKLARNTAVKYLCQSESDFFTSDEDYMYLNKELEALITNTSFIKQVKDALEFRKQEFYKNRLDDYSRKT
ncbi:DEAD/DEAH box helicase family protein [Turicibacter sanguinis]|uniref:DEAD/DEAH box helicase family protein n=2 Tax=Turicibacter sanguinis TaxID=154288 RepID=UPI0021D50127|nr:DEAD/DEAH box helicase family protein [Turicibacter sanguinis]MCU7202275.1 DEAD/DEAH box helicase family protein [Turicibacter sanguinis]MDB8458882.1 DEAD/DEAH box helicase family protein [Turicibacter sanguinis]